MFTLPPEIFYYRNIYTPSIHFYQENMDYARHEYINLKQRPNYFGYPYFYNPHRQLGEESKPYFLRCCRRLWEVLEDKNEEKCFVLAAYSGIESSDFGNIIDSDICAKFLCDVINANINGRYTLLLIDINYIKSINVQYSLEFKNTSCEDQKKYNYLKINLSDLHQLGDGVTDFTSKIVGNIILKLIKEDKLFVPVTWLHTSRCHTKLNSEELAKYGEGSPLETLQAKASKLASGKQDLIKTFTKDQLEQFLAGEDIRFV